jgi:hypothetical protein
MDKIKFIELTQGQYAIVDEYNFEYLNKYTWCVRNYYKNRFHAIRRKGPRINSKIIPMHRMAYGDVPEGYILDHINRDGLDNRRSNLRIATYPQNCANTSKKLKGYFLDKRNPINKYVSTIREDGKCKYIGYFATKKDAVEAYNKERMRIFGEFATLAEIPNE